MNNAIYQCTPNTQLYTVPIGTPLIHVYNVHCGAACYLPTFHNVKETSMLVFFIGFHNCLISNLPLYTICITPEVLSFESCIFQACSLFEDHFTFFFFFFKELAY